MASFYGPTSPVGPNDGDLWTNQTSGETRVFSGGTWVATTPSGTGAALGRRTVSTVTTAGAATYTAAQLLGGLILRDPNGAGRSDVSPTAALLVAAIPGVRVDDVFEFVLVNTADAAETITFTAGTGVTLVPAAITIAQNESGRVLVRFTAVAAGAEAVTMYAQAAGG